MKHRNYVVCLVFIIGILTIFSGCTEKETSPTSTPIVTSTATPIEREILTSEPEILIATIFSPDGNRVAYVSKLGDKEYVVVDGKKEKQYDFSGIGLTFSPDSKRVAYIAIVGNKQFVVVDGKEGKHYDSIEGFNFGTPNSTDVGYIAKEGDKRFAVITNGIEVEVPLS